MSTASRVSTGPSLAAFFAQHIDGRLRIPGRDWLDRWSWVAMLAMRFWAVGTASSSVLVRDARLLLLEEIRQGVRTPVCVVLEMKTGQSTKNAPHAVAFFDAGGGYPSLLALLNAWPRSVFPVPIRWIGTPDEDLRLAPNERRARAAGIVRDPTMSARVARALARTYGPFSLEWLAAELGEQW